MLDQQDSISEMEGSVKKKVKKKGKVQEDGLSINFTNEFPAKSSHVDNIVVTKELSQVSKKKDKMDENNKYFNSEPALSFEEFATPLNNNKANMKQEVSIIDIEDETLANNGKENVVTISIRDIEDTDSDLNENDIFNKLENKMEKKVEQPQKHKRAKEINWPEEDLKVLVDRMVECIPEKDTLAYGTRAEKLEWDTISFKDYTVEDCKKTWHWLQKKIRRFRLLEEVLRDAKEWIDKPKSSKTMRHPDMPRKPLTPYFIYYLKKKDMLHKAHPGLDAAEISKTLSQEFKSLPLEKRKKYEKLSAKQKKEYEEKLEEFYRTHPDIPRIVKPPKARTEKPQKTAKLTKPSKPPKPPKPPKPIKPQKLPKAPKPVKEKLPPKPPKRPPPPFQYYYLSELENQNVEDKIAFKELCKERWKTLPDKKKVIWINLAEVEYAKYEQNLKGHMKDHPDYVPNPHKLSLSKEEIQIKERAAGKPSKPPCSAYNLFARMLLKSDEIKNVPVKDRLIFVSNQWKNCMEEEKKQYQDLSAKMNEKYKLDFASYLETLPEEERKLELQKSLPKRRKSEDLPVKKEGPSRKRKTERKSTKKKIVEPEQPPISAFKYFATLYTGEEPVAQAWKALTPEQKKIYEDELVKKKQAYIVDFEKFLKSLTKEELEAFSNSRRKIKKDNDDEEEDEDEESTDESESEDSEVEDSNEENCEDTDN